jgi:hypothetical protein
MLQRISICALVLTYPTSAAATTTTAAMDLFSFYPPSSVLICKPCGYAVPPTTLSSHIRVHHLEDARHAATNPSTSSNTRNAAPLLATYLRQQYQLLDPATTKIPTPPATTPPIQDLTLYPRARLALSPEWRLAGDQIYAYTRAYLITPPLGTSAPAAVLCCAQEEKKPRPLCRSTSTNTALCHGSEAGKQR